MNFKQLLNFQQWLSYESEILRVVGRTCEASEAHLKSARSEECSAVVQQSGYL